MKKVIRLDVTIEQETPEYKAEIKVYECLFTEFNNVLDFDEIKRKVQSALKLTKGNFKMLTIDVYHRDEQNWGGRNTMVMGRRYVSSYGELTRATFNGDSYINWAATTKVRIYEDLKDAVNRANVTLVELLKEQQPKEAQ